MVDSSWCNSTKTTAFPLKAATATLGWLKDWTGTSHCPTFTEQEAVSLCQAGTDAGLEGNGLSLKAPKT